VRHGKIHCEDPFVHRTTTIAAASDDSSVDGRQPSDGPAGEMNRWDLTNVLVAVVDDAVRYRASCGFLLVALDNLVEVRAAHGAEVAAELIAATIARFEAKLRGGDALGRFADGQVGVILKNCTPNDITAAAERLLCVHDDVVATGAGPLTANITIGGVNAPRHGRTVGEVVARAHEALEIAKSTRPGSFHAYHPTTGQSGRRETIRSAGRSAQADVGFAPAAKPA
jgi:diguanylate cyclase (GGDEF)-like protein